MNKLETTVKALITNVKRAIGRYPRATTVGFNPLTCAVDVIYHATTVASILIDEETANVTRVVLNTGGWHTSTTKSRINAVLDALEIPFRTCHVNRALHFCGRWTTDKDGKHVHQSVPFSEGMIVKLTSTGKVKSVVGSNGRPVGIVRPKHFERLVGHVEGGAL